MPRPNEPIDHPHHVGLWLNYENVNGIDFWNNSFAIPAEKKNLYGHIKLDGIVETKSGKMDSIIYSANWENQQKNRFTKRENHIYFSRHMQTDESSTGLLILTAEQDISFADAKDGLLGIRVAHELELPSTERRQFMQTTKEISRQLQRRKARGYRKLYYKRRQRRRQRMGNKSKMVHAVRQKK